MSIGERIYVNGLYDTATVIYSDIITRGEASFLVFILFETVLTTIIIIHAYND